ncbi:MAG: hypothetical protein AAGI66_03660 [Cyanobacteria bacterium P01_H01_bin.74]
MIKNAFFENYSLKLVAVAVLGIILMMVLVGSALSAESDTVAEKNITTETSSKNPSNENKNVIDFIYIHGANTGGLGRQTQFKKNVEKLHRNVLNQLADNQAAKRALTQNGAFSVAEKPTVFIWSNLAEEAQENLTRDLNILKVVKTKLLASIQDTLGHIMQDTFWVVKPHNRYKVLTRLHAVINEKTAQGHQVVLLGYSAGSIVAFQYALNHLAFVNLPEVITREPGDHAEDIQRMLSSGFDGYSCSQALVQNHLAKLNNQGQFIGYFDDMQLADQRKVEAFQTLFYQEKLPQVGRYTEQHCLPQKHFRGLVTFGSPISVLTSHQDDSEGEMVKLFVKSVYEHKAFWLHVNHHDDPLGFPIYEDDLANTLNQRFDMNIHPDGGFFINDATMKKQARFYNAHGWYLKRPKSFASKLIQVYIRGVKTKKNQLENPNGKDN